MSFPTLVTRPISPPLMIQGVKIKEFEKLYLIFSMEKKGIFREKDNKFFK